MAFHLSTHASLLARLGEGDDDEAWREFHDRYHGLVRGFARLQGLQPVDADDVAQEVLMAVHQGIRDFDYDPSRGRFRGFLKTITLRSVWRRRQDDQRGQDEASWIDKLAGDPELEAQWESEWRQYHLRLARAAVRMEFPAGEIEAFDLVTAQGQSVADAARETGIPEARIYRIRTSVMNRMRELIARQVAEEG